MDTEKTDGTFKKYHLKCKIKFFLKDVKEDIGKGITQSYKRKLVLLVPDFNDEFSRFASAWLPDNPKTHFELAAQIGAPAHLPARCSVHFGHDEKFDKPYLFMMSKGVEDILVKYAEGTTIQVTTLPADQDSEADNTEADQGSYDVMQ